VTFNAWQVLEITISADGSRFAVISEEGGGGRLYFRTGDDLEFRPIPGAEGDLSSASFSPDGEWIAFAMGGRLMRASLLGGQPVELVRDDDIGVRLVDWGADGWVFFWASSPEGLGLFRVPDTGGPVERLVGDPEWSTFVPKAFPDGSGVLFTDSERGVAVHDIERDSTWVLTDLGVDALYSESGHLLFVDDGGGLWAAPFDLDGKVMTGDPKPVLEGVMTNFVYGRYSLSRTGTLVYTSGPSAGAQVGRELVVAGLDGSRVALELPSRRMGGVRWSPDGRSVLFAGQAAGEASGDDDDIYVYDTELENAPRRLTNTGDNFNPITSPDGRRVAFTSRREGTQDADVFIRSLDDDEPPRLVLSLPDGQWVTDWIEDDLLAIESGAPSGVFLVRLQGDSATVEPYYTPDADVDDLRVSPTGDLAAYASDESGQDEVYIRAFPDPRAETIVSEGGGRNPRWSPDGSTLYYQTLTGQSLLAAEIERNPTAVVVARRVVFDGQPAGGDLHPDGDRLIQTQVAGTPDEADVEAEPIRHVVIHNWFTELRRLFDVGN
jgi:Tol biopolymer transport system component